MGEVDGFIGVIGKISTVVGFGMQLDSIFGGSKPLTLEDIEAAVRQDIAAALQAQALEDQIIDASATLKSVQQFLSIDYLEAVGVPMDDDGLYGVLTNTTIGPLVAAMQQHVQVLQTWMNKSDLRTAAKALPVSLGLYLYLAIIHRERAKRTVAKADQGATHRSELADMRRYARAGVQDLAPRVVNLINYRLGRMDHLVDDNPDLPGRGYCVVDSLHDTWIDTWLFAFKMRDDDTQDYADALRWVIRASRNLLWSGAQADADEFTRSLTDGWLRLPGRVHQYDPSIGQTIAEPPWADNFRNTCLVPYTSFGKFVHDARTALLGLDAIAVGYSGKEQEDWAWCSSCGGLYFAGATSVCPVTKGAHARDQTTGNYALRCEPSGPSVQRVQNNWRWCKKCSGLFFDSGSRICAAGAAHDASASGSYELNNDAVPGANEQGLSDAQDNWRWCSKCSGLHFGSGASVCPAGGAHSSDGSGNYWLSRLGLLPDR